MRLDVVPAIPRSAVPRTPSSGLCLLMCPMSICRRRSRRVAVTAARSCHRGRSARVAGSPAGGCSRAVVHGDAGAPRVGRVSTAVPQASVPDQHRPSHLAAIGRTVCRSRGVVAEVEPGTSQVAPFASVKSVSAPSVAHGRRVRLRHGDQLIVRVDGWAVSPGRIAIDESDEISNRIRASSRRENLLVPGCVVQRTGASRL